MGNDQANEHDDDGNGKVRFCTEIEEIFMILKWTGYGYGSGLLIPFTISMFACDCSSFHHANYYFSVRLQMAI